ncbi:MAG: hypothetical protein OEY97_11000 [Nitrospirota bacterium]|nr:hypothetical protein [Nitrospirota bacterium]
MNALRTRLPALLRHSGTALLVWGGVALAAAVAIAGVTAFQYRPSLGTAYGQFTYAAYAGSYLLYGVGFLWAGWLLRRMAKPNPAPDRTPPRRFFAHALLAGGVLLAAVEGACTTSFFFSGVDDTLFDPGWYQLQRPAAGYGYHELLVMFGNLPMLLGLGLMEWGVWLRVGNHRRK